MAGRAYNGLNGAEIRQILAKEIDATLAGDDRFDTPDPIKITWTWKLETEQGDPRTPVRRSVSYSGSHMAPSGIAVRGKVSEAIADFLSRDQSFAHHLAFPRITWDWRLQMEIARTGEARVEVAPSADTERAAARREGSEAGVVARREAALTQSTTSGPGLVVVGPDGQQYQLVPMNHVAPIRTHMETVAFEPLKKAPVVEEPGEHVSRFRTATGLPITGGAAPSPGAELAASHSGGVFGKASPDVIEHAEVGMAHPTLEAGGLPAPDAVRREHGLPIPMPQKTGSGIVDLPANSF